MIQKSSETLLQILDTRIFKVFFGFWKCWLFPVEIWFWLNKVPLFRFSILGEHSAKWGILKTPLLKSLAVYPKMAAIIVKCQYTDKSLSSKLTLLWLCAWNNFAIMNMSLLFTLRVSGLFDVLFKLIITIYFCPTAVMGVFSKVCKQKAKESWSCWKR